MPARKSVSSLQDLCLRFVSSYIDIWCGKNEETVTLTAPLTKACIADNAVSRLPHVILNEICARKIRDEYLTVNQLNTIIHDYTDQLDFSGRLCDILSNHGVELMYKFCTNLTSLNLSKNRACNNSLIRLAESIPAIEYLNLQSTKASDHVLQNLGNNCPNLRDLNVINCEWVTDRGITALCLNNSATDQQKPGGHCCLIEKLFVEGTHVTDKGASTAVLNLPNLRIFDYPNLLKVLETICVENNSERRFKFEFINYLCHGKVDITNDTLDAVLRLCPDVTKFDIYTAKYEDNDWLPKLANFNQLNELSIFETCIPYCSDEVHYSRLSPVLRMIGNNLNSLTLSGVHRVNLWDIGKCCPKLSRLHLRYNQNYSSRVPLSNSDSKYLFGGLREVIIECLSDIGTIPSDQLQCLLSNCSRVNVLDFDDCQSLTDDLLFRVIQLNTFSKLRTFNVNACHNIRILSVLYILRNCERLKNITYLRGEGIRTTELHYLRDLIQKENLDVTLTYCVCTDYPCEHRYLFSGFL